MTPVDFYWRPGCPFCLLLEADLRRRNVPLRKHNIWENAEAAAAVRAVAEGNETVPTVVIGDVSFVNPRGAVVEDNYRRLNN